MRVKKRRRNTMSEIVLLSDVFKKRENESDLHRLDLYANRLEIKPLKSDSSNEKVKIFLKDLAGTLVERPFRTNDSNVYLIINAYPRTTINRLKRRKLTIEFAFNRHKQLKENFNRVNIWHENVDALLKSGKEYSYHKPFLVFVNPVSGSGKSRRLVLQHVLKVWNEADVRYKIVLTEQPNYARNFIQSTNDINEYRGIIVVSGDGLIHEVVNGLMSRPDWERAIKIPLGHIPAGSANGMASSVAFSNDELFQNISLEYFSSTMAFNLNKYFPKPLDLVAIQLENGTLLHSFLNVEWAIVADVDLESERYRYLGGLRFLVGALIRIMNLRVYKGRISFLPIDEHKNIQLKDPSIKILKNTTNYSNKKSITSSQFKYLTPLDKPVPNNWLTIEDKFVLFLVINLPLMGQDLFVSPDSKFDDETLLLVFVRQGATRKQLLDLFNNAGDGKFLENSFLEFVKVKAFRLEPIHEPEFDASNAALMVDGERVPYGNIQGEIVPKLGRILSGF